MGGEPGAGQKWPARVADSCLFGIVGCSKCVVEKRLEQVLGLTQHLALYVTEALHALHQGRELLLEGKRGHWDGETGKFIDNSRIVSHTEAGEAAPDPRMYLTAPRARCDEIRGDVSTRTNGEKRARQDCGKAGRLSAGRDERI